LLTNIFKIITNPFESIINTDQSKKDIPVCPYCKKVFYQNANLNKHIKNNCKIKKKQNDNKEIIFKDLLEKDKKITLLIEQTQLLLESLRNFVSSDSWKLSKLEKIPDGISSERSSAEFRRDWSDRHLPNPGVLEKAVNYSYTKQKENKEQYKNNKSVLDRIMIINKYIQMCNNDYIQDLQVKAEDEKNIITEIKKCEKFKLNAIEKLKLLMYNKKDIVIKRL